jgi:hypothetical protein
MKAVELTNVSVCEIKQILLSGSQTYVKRNTLEVCALLECYIV